MIPVPDYWKKIAGMHAEEDGTLGVCWLALDDRSSVVHCYNAATFKREVLPVIASSIHALGGWIPMAWRKQDEPFAKQLLDAKINVLPEASSDNPAIAEVSSRELELRMRGSRFRVYDWVYPWLEEYKGFYRDASKIPDKGFPLMSATRHAMQQLSYAKALSMPGSKRQNHPGIKVI